MRENRLFTCPLTEGGESNNVSLYEHKAAFAVKFSRRSPQQIIVSQDFMSETFFFVVNINEKSFELVDGVQLHQERNSLSRTVRGGTKWGISAEIAIVTRWKRI